MAATKLGAWDMDGLAYDTSSVAIQQSKVSDES